ncbi:hypothetical protein [Bacillus pumilus]|uniref:hypothetical protein n=1 Tax=Bacillus pumilus TaxID=1408 RepID=UPI00227FBD64|nr:hypothetical protein [Bacillus pumilus]MCY7500154.1 hypothetical protein [Bacillus pumilus]MCY7528522.1 hypothetical protein [Bacillus pumilus]MED4439520.1 hypothetical protein [Bacillus pumilus]MED4489963.1 hypothetical protein [Bacillus pumilus]
MNKNYIKSVFSKEESIFSNDVYKYTIYHKYDSNPREDMVTVGSSIPPNKFELLLAHLLFKAVELTGVEEIELYQNEIKEILYKKYEDKQLHNKPSSVIFNRPLDLYEVWEKWCSNSTYQDVLNIEEFQVEGLNEIILDTLLKRKDSETDYILRNFKAWSYLEKAAEQLRFTDEDAYKFDVIDVVSKIEDIKKIIKGNEHVNN